MTNISIEEFEKARKRLSPILHHTELDPSSTFSALTGGDIYLKCENRQKTGSFKIRGATNKIAALVEAGGVKSVVASSAGNHAQGVAYAAHNFGIPATIVMPAAAPIVKVQATQGYGARVVLAGDCYDDAYAEACRICKDEGATFLHPYNDLDVMAGQGTLGLEILGDLPNADVIITPVGGGGLLGGVATAVKQINPRVKVIGVQAEGADAMVRSFETGKLTTTDSAVTIADGIAVKGPGDISFELIKHYADDLVRVSDSEIAEAILLLIERCKQIVEPAGASPLAAVLNGRVDVKGKRVVCLMSGGNIDVSFIQSIIEQGLFARHRRIKFTVKLLDRPGSLVKLLNIIASTGANVLTVEHDKLQAGLNPNETTVHIACEVGGEEHGAKLVSAIREAGLNIITED